MTVIKGGVGMSVWTNDDICFLKNNYSKFTNEELTSILNKTMDSIRYKASSLKLKKVTIDSIRDFLLENNYELISKDYINAKTPLLIKCKEHNIIKEAKWSDIKQEKFRCEKCKSETISNALKSNFSNIVKLFDDKNLTLLTIEDEFNNTKQKLKYKCKLHSDIVQYTTVSSLRQTKIGCPICAKKSAIEKIKITDEEILRRCNVHNCTPIDIDTFKGVEEPLLVRCNIHNCEYYFSLNNYNNTKFPCPICNKENISGKNSHLWKGGITELSAYLRTLLNEWKKESLKNYNYKCCVTGNTNDLEIHHIYPFSKIVQDVLNKLDLDVRENISEYTSDELLFIETEFLKIHKQKYGVPIIKRLHKEFHSEYGLVNFEERDFEQFIKNKTIK